MLQKQAAPEEIKKIISCACKSGCTKKCGCAKAGLRCTTMCRNCHGSECFNKELYVDDDLEDLLEGVSEETEDLI